MALCECLRPVSGLASFDVPPSQAWAQWLCGTPALTYRCGGSIGIALSKKELTDFPFNLGTQHEQGTYDGTILDHGVMDDDQRFPC